MTQQHCVALSDTKASCIPQKSYDELVGLANWLWVMIIAIPFVLAALPWLFKKIERKKGKL